MDEKDEIELAEAEALMPRGDKLDALCNDPASKPPAEWFQEAELERITPSMADLRVIAQQNPPGEEWLQEEADGGDG